MSAADKNGAIGVASGLVKAQQRKPLRYLGRRVGFLGDSITNGSTAANINLAYVNQVIEQIGSASMAKVGAGSVQSGHPGFRSDQIAPFLASDIIAGNCDTLVTLQGTNDAKQLVPLATYAANMLAQFRAAREAGLSLIVLTVPPRGTNSSPTSAEQALIASYNAWLRLVVPQYGTLVDIHKKLLNLTSGNLNIAYDSGDGIHPNSLGHWIIAQLVVAALRATVARPFIMDDVTSFNLITNPFFVSDTVGWFEQPGGTGTAPTYSRPADTSSFLSTGNWLEMDFDGTSSGGIRTYASSITAGKWAVGDTVAITGKMQLLDTSGDWQSLGPGAAGTAFVNIKLVDGSSGVALSTTPLPLTGLGYPVSAGLYNFGPFFETCVIPAGVTTLAVWAALKVPTGSHYKMHLGEIGVVNMTASGLASAPLAI